MSPPRRGRPPRCIIMAPTRELAKQVEREFQGAAPGLRTGCYYGGESSGCMAATRQAFGACACACCAVLPGCLLLHRPVGVKVQQLGVSACACMACSRCADQGD